MRIEKNVLCGPFVVSLQCVFSITPPPHFPPYLTPPFFLYTCEVKTIVGADADQIMQTIKQLQ